MKKSTLKYRTKRGRPRKDTPDTIDVIREALEDGCTRKAACALAGIHRDTFYQWMAENPEFSDTIARAEATAERRWIELALTSRQGHNAVKLLAKRFRDDWGDKLEVENKGEQKITVTVTHTRPDPKV